MKHNEFALEPLSSFFLKTLQFYYWNMMNLLLKYDNLILQTLWFYSWQQYNFVLEPLQLNLWNVMTILELVGWCWQNPLIASTCFNTLGLFWGKLVMNTDTFWRENSRFIQPPWDTCYITRRNKVDLYFYFCRGGSYITKTKHKTTNNRKKYIKMFQKSHIHVIFNSSCHRKYCVKLLVLNEKDI